MAGLAAMGPVWTDLILNAIFRGSVGTPPTTIYFSLGQTTNATTIPVEVTGMTRSAVKCNRGWMNGADSFNYPYQSSGNAFYGDWNILKPIDIYCSGLGASVYDTPTVMIWDALTGGNLLAVFEPTVVNRVPQVIDGDIVRVYNTERYVTDVQNNLTGTEYGILWSPGSAANGTRMGNYMLGVVADWLFRGFDSMNGLFSPASFPNVYANLYDTNNGTVLTTVPRATISRATGTWSAPVAQNAGVNLERKIANSATIAFPAATAAGSYSAGQLLMDIRMSNTPQTFDDILYRMTVGAVSWALGDVIRFTAGNLEIVLN